MNAVQRGTGRGRLPDPAKAATRGDGAAGAARLTGKEEENTGRGRSAQRQRGTRAETRGSRSASSRDGRSEVCPRGLSSGRCGHCVLHKRRTPPPVVAPLRLRAVHKAVFYVRVFKSTRQSTPPVCTPRTQPRSLHEATPQRGSLPSACPPLSPENRSTDATSGSKDTHARSAGTR